MFDQTMFDNMIPFERFTYWFTRISDNKYAYGQREAFLGQDETPLSVFDEDMVGVPADVLEDFAGYKTRPEFKVGVALPLAPTISANSRETMIDWFEKIITGAAFIRALNAKRNPDTAFAAVTRFLDWIRQTDFYNCPGSTRFHDAEPSGLLFHSLNVYNNIIDLKNLKKFKNVEYHSMALISLCHDFTKIGNYESYLRNVKNEQTGQWEQVPSFRWKCNPFPFGHGVASMYIVTQFFRLSVEEMLAIRWHMGEYNVSERECGELEDASEQYPMVRMIQFADQLACTKY